MIKLAETPEEYTKELVEALSDLDENKIKAHMKKYDLVISDNPLMFWGSVYNYKAITAGTRFPMKLRQKAKRWLIKHKLQPWDDGDIVV